MNTNRKFHFILIFELSFGYKMWFYFNYDTKKKTELINVLHFM